MCDVYDILVTALSWEFRDDRGQEIDLKMRIWVVVKHLVLLAISVLMIVWQSKGFNDDFCSLLVSVFSIIVGVFISVLIFGVGTLFVVDKHKSKTFEISISKGGMEQVDTSRISVSPVEYLNTRQKDWEVKSRIYSKRIIYTLSLNVILSIVVLCLLFLYVYAPEWFGVYITEYEWCNLTKESFCLFLHVAMVICARVFIVWIAWEVLSYSCRLIHAILKFVEARNNIE